LSGPRPSRPVAEVRGRGDQEGRAPDRARRIATGGKGRNEVEDGEAVARATGPGRTANRDGPRWARSSAFFLPACPSRSGATPQAALYI